MATVTERIKEITQPKGGYLPLSVFEKIQFNDNVVLNKKENIAGSVIGSTVDYISHFIYSKDIRKALKYPFLGLSCAAAITKDSAFENEIPKSIFEDMRKGFSSDIAICAACRLASFDVWYRNPTQAVKYHSYENINPNSATIENVRTLIRRTVAFYKRDSVKFDEDYLAGGFSSVVDKGDFDFLTSDTLWDLKVAKEDTMKKSSKDYTLQVLMYWIIGQHSGHEIFKNVSKIGLFNPRSNTAYLLDIAKIDKEIIKAVERDVICY